VPACPNNVNKQTERKALTSAKSLFQGLKSQY
jgi:hypothetical protein